MAGDISIKIKIIMLKHYHVFEYRVDEGCEGIPEQNIRFEINGDCNLDEILEKFRLYLIATEFGIKDNETIEVVEKE